MPRILIADDSEATRRALRNLVQGNGWDVCGEAEDGLSAVEKAAILKPDLQKARRGYCGKESHRQLDRCCLSWSSESPIQR
jgi:DNA-binding NarL/FixJ family response regulator